MGGAGTYLRRVGWVRSVGLGPPITVMISKVCSFHRSKSIGKVEHLLPFEIAFVTGSCSIFAPDFDPRFVRFDLFVALLASIIPSVVHPRRIPVADEGSPDRRTKIRSFYSTFRVLQRIVIHT